MSHELRRALDDLVQDVASQQDIRARAADDSRVAAMVSRAHRNRVRRAALVSAVTACAVVAVAAGGVAVATWDRSAPQPAGPSPTTTSPSPTPTPTEQTPTPTTPATVLPAGDPAAPLGACGSLVPGAASTTPHLALGVALDSDEALLGAPTVVRTVLAATTQTTGGFVADSGPTVVVAQDGVVVATASTYPPGTGPTSVSYLYDVVAQGVPVVRAARTVSHVTPVVCDAPGASTGAPLPAGDYEVLAFADTWTATNDDAFAFLSDGVYTLDEVSAGVAVAPHTVVSAATPLHVAPEPVDPATLPVPPTTAPALGDRNVADDLDFWPDVCNDTLTPGDAGGLLPVSGPTGTATTGDDLAVRVTYTGRGRIALGNVVGYLKLVQDGRVVAVSTGPTQSVDLDHGGDLALGSDGSSWRTCGGGTGTPASGTYTAYPVVLGAVLGLTDADGTVVQPRGSEVPQHQLIGEPFTLVVP